MSLHVRQALFALTPLGAVMCVLSALDPSDRGVIARVNGVPITADQVAATEALVEENAMLSDSASPGSGAALDYLIDEELLIQQALRIGLVERDRRLRNVAIQAALAASGDGCTDGLHSGRGKACSDEIPASIDDDIANNPLVELSREAKAIIAGRALENQTVPSR